MTKHKLEPFANPKPPAEPPLESWTEIRNGVTWHIIAVAGEGVFNWCDRPPVPAGICSPREVLP